MIIDYINRYEHEHILNNKMNTYCKESIELYKNSRCHRCWVFTNLIKSSDCELPICIQCAKVQCAKVQCEKVQCARVQCENKNTENQ